MTDGNSEEVARGGGEEEAAWLELIGRFDAPAGAADAAVPWPERENLGPRPAPSAPSAPSAPAAPAGPAAPAAPAVPAAGAGAEPENLPRIVPLSPGGGPGGPAPPAAGLPATAGPRAWVAPDEDEEHFTPPPPPPLPALPPAAKAAWAGLFGGPAYLLAATLAGWSVPGWALFAAIAAFVGGFTVLVLRHGGGSDQDSGPGDDGAVL